MVNLFNQLIGSSPNQSPSEQPPDLNRLDEEVRAKAEYYNQLENLVMFLNSLIKPTEQDVKKVMTLVKEMSTANLNQLEREYIKICTDSAEIALMLGCPSVAISEMEDVTELLLTSRSIDNAWFTHTLLAVNIKKTTEVRNEQRKPLGV